MRKHSTTVLIAATVCSVLAGCGSTPAADPAAEPAPVGAADQPATHPLIKNPTAPGSLKESPAVHKALKRNNNGHAKRDRKQTPKTVEVTANIRNVAAVVPTAAPTAPTPTPTVVTAQAAASTNPLAGRTWGVYKGNGDQAWAPYASSTGERRKMLAKIALRPKAKWFGAWIPEDQIASKVRAYITNSQAGDKDALVQMAVFRMKPWEHEACRRLPTAAEQAAYKRWTNNFASAIGNAHVALILQPDGPFALCAPKGSTLPSSLIAYSARKYASLPNVSVYIDAGAADWPAAGRQGGVTAATRILTQGGVKYARGFALNSTHYSDTNLEVARATAISQALAAKGMPGKKAVINTANSGHPFVFGNYTGSDPDNAFVCKTKTEPKAKTCVTLGIPPTADVGNTKWRLWASTNSKAKANVDGYLWFGRPWLYRQNDPFVMQRALDLVRSTPF